MYTVNVELHVGKNYFKIEYDKAIFTLDGMAFCIVDEDTKYKISNIDLLDRFSNSSIELVGGSISSFNDALELVKADLETDVLLDEDIEEMLKEC